MENITRLHGFSLGCRRRVDGAVKAVAVVGEVIDAVVDKVAAVFVAAIAIAAVITFIRLIVMLASWADCRDGLARLILT